MCHGKPLGRAATPSGILAVDAVFSVPPQLLQISCIRLKTVVQYRNKFPTNSKYSLPLQLAGFDN